MRFILVDKILEMVPGKSILGVKRIDENEDYFGDHFPGFPVVPGVLLTEMMAQTAGKCLDVERLSTEKAMLAQITSAKFREWVRPGDTAFIHAKIRTNRKQFATAVAFIEVNDKKACSAELFFTFMPLVKLNPDYVDEVLQSYILEKSKS